MLFPILVDRYGPRQAMPVMAIAALMSNVGKVAAWWREVDLRVFAAYSAAGIPAAALGARLCSCRLRISSTSRPAWSSGP